MNKISKFLLITLIALAGIFVIAKVTGDPSPQDKFAGEAVRVLENYKDFRIDAQEAAERIDDINKDVAAARKTAKTHDEENRLLGLSINLDSIYLKLHNYGKASGYEIDQAIKAIKSN